MNFIKTTDKETAKKLRELGFTEIPENGSSCFVFLNDKTFKFEDTNLKVSYSNQLSI